MIKLLKKNTPKLMRHFQSEYFQVDPGLGPKTANCKYVR